MVPSAGQITDLPTRMQCATPEAIFGFKWNRAMPPDTGYALVLETFAVWPSRRRQGIAKRFLVMLATKFPESIMESVLTHGMRAALESTGMWVRDPTRPGDWFVTDKLLLASRKARK